MNLDGLNQVRLTNTNFNESTPSYSPDGQLIAFKTDKPGTKEIAIINANDCEYRELTVKMDVNGVVLLLFLHGRLMERK